MRFCQKIVVRIAVSLVLSAAFLSFSAAADEVIRLEQADESGVAIDRIAGVAHNKESYDETHTRTLR